MKEYQSGQVLLIVVLVMVVSLTVGLSIAARTVTSLRTSNETEYSERAFSAAEAGLEKTLATSLSTSGSLNNTATYQTTKKNLSGVELLLNNGVLIPKDDAVDIYLADYPTYANPRTGNVTLYWGSASDACSLSEATNTLAALRVIVLSGTKANPTMTQYPLDACSSRSGNNFEQVVASGGTIAGKTFQYKKTFSVTSGLLVRIIPLYASTVIGVTGCDGQKNNCSALPIQGTIIESVGTADNTTRKILTFQGYPRVPTELFPFTLFSPK